MRALYKIVLHTSLSQAQVLRRIPSQTAFLASRAESANSFLAIYRANDSPNKSPKEAHPIKRKSTCIQSMCSYSKPSSPKT